MGNLNIPQMTANQSSPEITHNNGLLALEQAITEKFSINATSNVTLTDLEYQRNLLFVITTSTSGKSVTLWTTGPIKRSLTLWDNQSANSVNLVVGSTSIALPNGAQALVATDGTTNGLTVYQILTGSQPYDIGFSISGSPTASQKFTYIADRVVTLPSGAPNWQAKAGTGATGSPSFSINKNGSPIGSVSWSGGTGGSFTFSSTVTLAIGDILTIVAPASPDATLADIGISIAGTR